MKMSAAVKLAELNEHRMQDDPPHSLSKAVRYTCTKCGKSVLSYEGGNAYGTAITEGCRSTTK